MFMRTYFLVRTLMNFSEFAELNSKRICVRNGFEQGTSFCLKAMVTKYPGETILFVAIISISWLAYLLRIFERYIFCKNKLYLEFISIGMDK